MATTRPKVEYIIQFHGSLGIVRVVLFTLTIEPPLLSVKREKKSRNILLVVLLIIF